MREGEVLLVVSLQYALVGASAHEHDFEHREVKSRAVMLREHGLTHRRFAHGEIAQFITAQEHLANLRLQHAVDTLQERALAAAVRPDDANGFFVFYRKIDALDDLTTIKRFLQIFYADLHGLTLPQIHRNV